MKGKQVVLLSILFMFSISGLTFGDSVWEGNAAVSRYGELPVSGLFGASNTFPLNTMVRVQNRRNGKIVNVFIVSKLHDSGIFLLLSPQAAQELAVESGAVVPVRISLNETSSGSPGSPGSDPFLSQDPDLNPAAGLRPSYTAPSAEGDGATASGRSVLDEVIAELRTRPPRRVPEELSAESNPGERALSEGEEEAAPEISEEAPVPDIADAVPEEKPEAESGEKSPPEIPEISPVIVERTDDMNTDTDADDIAVPGIVSPAAAELERPDVPAVTEAAPLPAEENEEVPVQHMPDFAMVLPADGEETSGEAEQDGEEPEMTAEAEDTLEDDSPAEFPDSGIVPAPDPAETREPELSVPDISLPEAEEDESEVPETDVPLRLPENAELTLVPAEPRPPVLDSPDTSDALSYQVPDPDASPAPVLTPGPLVSADPLPVPSGQAVPAPLEDRGAAPAAVQTPAAPEVAIAETGAIADAPLMNEVASLDRDAYYLQLGVFSSREVADRVVGSVPGGFPLAVLRQNGSEKPVYKVLIGPLGDDERGSVLYMFRNSGFRDAYLRRGE